MKSKIALTILSFLFLFGCSISYNPTTDTSSSSPTSTNPNLKIRIPTVGNSWVIKNGKYTSSELITPQGVANWRNPKDKIRTFFYVEQAGKISLGISAKVQTGVSKLQVTFGNKTQNITLQGNGFMETYLGNFQVNRPGYYFLELAGLEKSGDTYAEVQDVLLGGANSHKTKYIRDDYYFARRGPSVHLNFELPAGVDNVEWFYSELTVPRNQDVVGSYFMANGFGEGYFGIQVNSPTERKILFSIWSPYETDNPAEIPEAFKIKVLKKGAGVITGQFGNEGSGGQSYKMYDWKAGVKYGFLVGAKPSGNGNTDYTAYFHDPSKNKWDLIAQFRRPKTTTYLKGLYSFLENFIPDTGVLERKALYENQWAYDAAGWHELTKIIFTADNTARKENRVDYSGGVENDVFYLKNCGFTNDQVLIDSKFERSARGKKPSINFSRLE